MNKMAVKGRRGNDLNMHADEVTCTPGHLQRDMRSFYRCPKMLNHMVGTPASSPQLHAPLSAVGVLIYGLARPMR